ncbi:MAG TPA: glycosyltransferase [Candidatus Limnocylindrales bacterium]|jgi:glycogen synthase
MPGSWPEPFGLVAIEAMACGTPVVARRIGALPEIIRDGIDGFFGDDVAQMVFKLHDLDRLDRSEIRQSVLERFSAVRMTDGYLALYDQMLATSAPERAGSEVAEPVRSDGITRLRTARPATATAPRRESLAAGR